MNNQPSPIEPETGSPDSWIADRLPPPSSFFPGTAYNDILERVHGLVEGAEEVALLTGVQGAGKTTLLYRIQSDTPEHWLPCRVDANPMLRPDQLLRRLARCIDITPLDEVMAESIAAAFCKLRLQGRLPVVMVDDAEQLPTSSLITLLRLHEQRAEAAPACALILLAQPGIDCTLSTEQLHAMGTARFVHLELPRLADDETAEYIRHFLRMEGVEDELQFSPQQLAALHSESGGLPGKVNELVILNLRDATAPRRVPLGSRILRWLRRIPPATGLATSAVALLLLSTLLFQRQIDSLLQEPEPTTASLSETRQNQRQEAPIQEQEERTVQPLLLPPVAERLDTAAEPLRQAPELETDTRIGTEVSEPPAQKTEPGEMLAVARAPMQPATPTPSEEPPAAPKPAAAPALVQMAPAVADPRFKRESWLLKQRPEAYSLQILVSGNERTIRQFARDHRLTTDVYYFVSQRNGRPWIALLLGIYKDRPTAVTVLKMLPDSLRKAGAWPRSLRSIQEEIKQVW